MSILFCGFYGSWIIVFTLFSPFVIGDSLFILYKCLLILSIYKFLALGNCPIILSVNLGVGGISGAVEMLMSFSWGNMLYCPFLSIVV